MPTPQNAPTNGNHGKRARTETIKHRSFILGMKRIPKTKRTRGGDDKKSRDKGRGQ